MRATTLGTNAPRNMPTMNLAAPSWTGPVVNAQLSETMLAKVTQVIITGRRPNLSASGEMANPPTSIPISAIDPRVPAMTGFIFHWPIRLTMTVPYEIMS